MSWIQSWMSWIQSETQRQQKIRPPFLHPMPLLLNQESAKFFCKGPGSGYFRLVGHPVSIPTTHLCLCSKQVATASMSIDGCGRVLSKLYLQKQVAGMAVGFQPLESLPGSPAPQPPLGLCLRHLPISVLRVESVRLSPLPTAH